MQPATTSLSAAEEVLLTDLYELTMVDAYRRAGMAERPATFSLFVRALPAGWGALVAAGLDDALGWLERLRFDDEALAILEGTGRFSPEFLDWLAGLRFTGDVRAVAEGTPVFAAEPILEVDAPVAEAQLAETFLLNQVTLQTTLASKAARFRAAAGDAGVVDFGLRRTPGTDAGMKVSRVGRIVGLSGTSNVAGAHRYGLAAVGTMAHSFVQAHPDETEAFRTFARAYGSSTVLLVDTYDTHRGIERAIEVAQEMRARGEALAGIRLDSGDLVALARHARARLDAAGLREVAIHASGGLDEYAVARLRHEERAPIDAFGVGTRLGAPDDAPTLDSVYKLVRYDGRPVRKTSSGKATWPGAKQLWRRPGGDDVLALADEPAPGEGYEPLLETVMAAGRRTDAGRRSLDDAHRHFDAAWHALPSACRALEDAVPLSVHPSAAVVATADALDREHAAPPSDQPEEHP